MNKELVTIVLPPLTEPEQRLAVYMAKMKTLISKKYNARETNESNLDKHEIELNGYGAELAFCRHYNVYPDIELHHPKKLPPYDCTLPSGTRVDVKATWYKTGGLIAPARNDDKKDKVDAFVLLIGNFPQYTLMGYATSAEMFIKKNLTDLNRPGTSLMHKIEQGLLHPIEELK